MVIQRIIKGRRWTHPGGGPPKPGGGGGKGIPGGKPGGLKPGGPAIPGGKGIGGRASEGGPTNLLHQKTVTISREETYLGASCPYRVLQAYHAQVRLATDTN